MKQFVIVNRVINPSSDTPCCRRIAIPVKDIEAIADGLLVTSKESFEMKENIEDVLCQMN